MSGDDAARAWAEALAPVTDAMLDMARPRPGERVLDVGAGAGQLALEIASAVGPAGEVLAIDPSADAIAAIEQRAATAHPNCAPLRAMRAAAESLDAGEALFDLAIARNSVMYFDDLERGLARVKHALRPGGRLVASVYAALDQEPFHAVPLAAVTRRSPLSRPLPEYAAAFELDADRLEAALHASGWQAVARRVVPVRRNFRSLDTLAAALRGSRSLAELLGRLPAEEHAEAWREIDAGFERYAGPSGVAIDGCQVVVIATA